MKIRRGILVRFLFAASCLATFFLAVFLGGMVNDSFGVLSLIITALVFYIVSLGGLLIAHHREGRSVFEILLVFSSPFAVRFILIGNLDFQNPGLWIFIGVFMFIVIAGGFFLGVVLSPLIARLRGQSPRKTGGTVRAGFRHIRRSVPLDFAVSFAAGIIIALFLALFQVFSSILPEEEAGGRAVGYVFLAAGLALTAWFTYRHTRFGLNENKKLHDLYDRRPGDR